MNGCWVGLEQQLCPRLKKRPAFCLVLEADQNWTVLELLLPCSCTFAHQMPHQCLYQQTAKPHSVYKSSLTNSRRYPGYIHTHTRLTALCPGLPGWAGTRKVKPVWISLKQEILSGSGISWPACKSAPRSRQITTPTPHHSIVTGRMLFLSPNQQHQRTEGKYPGYIFLNPRRFLCDKPYNINYCNFILAL